MTARAERSAAGESVDGPITDLRAAVVAQMDRVYDAQNGGWGKLKTATAAHLDHAWSRAYGRGEAMWHERGLLTAEAMSKPIDAQWGGVFVGSYGDWDHAIPEKRIVNRGAALQAFSHAYRLTGDNKWISRAAQVDRYVRSTLQSSDGTFYTSQEDRAAGLPRHMSARDYYDLPGAQRERYGQPPVDHAVYTHRNALMIRAYVAIAEATQSFYQLGVYAKDKRYGEAANAAVRAMGTAKDLAREGSDVAVLGIALDPILAGYVEFTVVGDRTDPRVGHLHQAALDVYEPRKIVHFEAPGRYPDQGEPALFVCSETACSSPIKDPAKVAAVAQRFAAVEPQ